jgi:hypothetical protein
VLLNASNPVFEQLPTVCRQSLDQMRIDERGNPARNTNGLWVAGRRLGNDDHSPAMLLPLPSFLHFAKRNPLSIDAELTVGNIEHQLPDGF